MGSGNCVFWAPETFDLSDDGHAVVPRRGGHGRGAAAHRRAGLPGRCHLAVARRRRGAARGGDVVPIAVTEDHESLRRTAQRWAPDALPAERAAGRGRGAGAGADLPAVWEKMAAQGWLGLHLPEAQGGAGLHAGRAGRGARGAGPRARSPGPLLPTVLVSAVAGPPRRRRRCGPRCCPAWPTARSPAAVALGADPTPAAGRTARPAPTLAGARCARCSGCPRRGSCWCRSTRGADGVRGWLLDREALGDAVVGRGAPGRSTAPAPLGQLEIGGDGLVTVPGASSVLRARRRGARPGA